MTPRTILMCALLAVAGCASNAALAQGPGPADGDRMMRMQGMTERFEHAHDDEERRALMQEHMTLMHEQMAEMQGTMDHGAGEGMPEMSAMHEHMGMMQGMMMQMMAQQDMMMRMREADEPPAEEDGE